MTQPFVTKDVEERLKRRGTGSEHCSTGASTTDTKDLTAIDTKVKFNIDSGAYYLQCKECKFIAMCPSTVEYTVRGASGVRKSTISCATAIAEKYSQHLHDTGKYFEWHMMDSSTKRRVE
nr:uncharacterized protein CI109_007219 [Kwoniella shandongensis]KAA5524469.1 hypothetical protein CI109_007219 [Kwoniella shandongensis]